MQELFNWHFSENEIKELVYQNKSIIKLSDNDISNMINILINIGCNNTTIKDIIITNPFYLNRMKDDVIELINKLRSIGINDLDVLFENDPFLLNKDVYEINNFINKKINNGMDINEIIELIETNSIEEL